MPTRRAECACGQLAAVCEGEPTRVSVCHCFACKRRTGSAFSFNVRYVEAQVAVEGEARTFTRIGDEGGHIISSFCPNCGATVCYRIVEDPGIVAIAGGAFADLSLPPPTRSVYDSSRSYAWMDIRTKPWSGWASGGTAAVSVHGWPGRARP